MHNFLPVSSYYGVMHELELLHPQKPSAWPSPAFSFKLLHAIIMPAYAAYLFLCSLSLSFLHPFNIFFVKCTHYFSLPNVCTNLTHASPSPSTHSQIHNFLVSIAHQQQSAYMPHIYYTTTKFEFFVNESGMTLSVWLCRNLLSEEKPLKIMPDQSFSQRIQTSYVGVHLHGHTNTKLFVVFQGKVTQNYPPKMTRVCLKLTKNSNYIVVSVIYQHSIPPPLYLFSLYVLM